jgi:hypothetical protein
VLEVYDLVLLRECWGDENKRKHTIEPPEDMEF